MYYEILLIVSVIIVSFFVFKLKDPFNCTSDKVKEMLQQVLHSTNDNLLVKNKLDKLLLYKSIFDNTDNYDYIDGTINYLVDESSSNTM